jgi:DNA-binding transcriptional regulator YbjK
MKRRTGMQSKQKRAKAATRALSRDGFHAFVSFREITTPVKPGNSDLP